MCKFADFKKHNVYALFFNSTQWFSLYYVRVLGFGAFQGFRAPKTVDRVWLVHEALNDVTNLFPGHGPLEA